MSANCDVCLSGSDFCDGDSEFYSRETPKARKPHKCCECRRVINPGEIYERAAGKFDGSMWAEKTCLQCFEIRDKFYCNGGWMFGDLWEQMREYAFPKLTTASECFVGLSPAAKQFLLDKWCAWKFQ